MKLHFDLKVIAISLLLLLLVSYLVNLVVDLGYFIVLLGLGIGWILNAVVIIIGDWSNNDLGEK